MLVLTRLDPSHAAAVLAFESANRSYFAASISDRGDAFFSEFAQRHDATLAEQDSGECAFYVLLDEDGSVLGRVNLYNIENHSADLGYRVAERAAGRGLATAAVEELCRVAAVQLGLRSLRAAVSDANAASRRVLTKAGFHPTGSADPAQLGGKHGTLYQRDLGAVTR